MFRNTNHHVSGRNRFFETLESRTLLNAGDFLDAGPFVSDSTLHEPAAIVEPGLGQTYVDPVFATTVKRLTVTPAPRARKSTAGLVPEYSKVQAWNCDDSLLLLRCTDGRSFLLNGQTLSGARPTKLPGGDIEPRWSPTNPNTLYYLLDEGVYRYSVKTDKSVLVARMKGMGQLSSGAEQELPADGRYLAMHGTEVDKPNGQYVSTKAFVVDLKTGKAGPTKVLKSPGNNPDDFLDYVAMTPDSKYVMVMWASHGADLYTPNWKYVRRLTTWDEHGDFAQYEPGKYAFVQAHYRPDTNDETIELSPLDGSPRRTLWLAPAFNMGLHISARNTALPGWVFVSSYWDGLGQRPGATPFENEVFALSLSSTVDAPVVRRLAHTNTLERADYFDEPHATVRQDGRVILFASNFGRFVKDENYDDTYAIDLRGI